MHKHRYFLVFRRIEWPGNRSFGINWSVCRANERIFKHVHASAYDETKVKSMGSALWINFYISDPLKARWERKGRGNSAISHMRTFTIRAFIERVVYCAFIPVIYGRAAFTSAAGNANAMEIKYEYECERERDKIIIYNPFHIPKSDAGRACACVARMRGKTNIFNPFSLLYAREMSSSDTKEAYFSALHVCLAPTTDIHCCHLPFAGRESSSFANASRVFQVIFWLELIPNEPTTDIGYAHRASEFEFGAHTRVRLRTEPEQRRPTPRAHSWKAMRSTASLNWSASDIIKNAIK